jgi:hypothetical protein
VTVTAKHIYSYVDSLQASILFGRELSESSAHNPILTMLLLFASWHHLAYQDKWLTLKEINVNRFS